MAVIDLDLHASKKNTYLYSTQSMHCVRMLSLWVPNSTKNFNFVRILRVSFHAMIRGIALGYKNLKDEDSAYIIKPAVFFDSLGNSLSVCHVWFDFMPALLNLDLFLAQLHIFSRKLEET